MAYILTKPPVFVTAGSAQRASWRPFPAFALFVGALALGTMALAYVGVPVGLTPGPVQIAAL